MNILLTNDDGIHAQGINVLYKCLSRKHSVYIVAPDKEKSGCSSAITMKEELKIETLSENRFAVHGFTADCVNVGLKGDILPEIDLVISGINHGPNCGDDIYFSGTVAGARVGYIYGITGIAVSLDCYGDSSNFIGASQFMLEFIEDFRAREFKNPVLLNINYPDLPKEKISEIKYTKLGKREYRDSYRILYKDKNEIRMQFTGGMTGHENLDSDITELKKGHISITPLTLDCTDKNFLLNNPA